MTTTTTATLALTRIASVCTTCACCDRPIRKGFVLSDGRTYGRKCAALATGYPTTAVEHAARQAEFIARKNEARRAAGWGVTEFLVWMADSTVMREDGMVEVAGERLTQVEYAERLTAALYVAA